MAKLWTLGSLDDIMPDIDNCHVLCFPVSDSRHEYTGRILSKAYDCLLAENPVLGTMIMASDDTSFRPGKKTLRAAESKPCLELKDGSNLIGLSYEELKSLDMPREFLDPSVVTPSRETGDPSASWSTAMRATFIAGGCLLAFNTSHALMDGVSVVNVIAAMAAHATEISQTITNDDSCWMTSGSTPGQFSRRFEATNADIETINPAVPTAAYDSLKKSTRSWHMLGLDYRPKEASSAVLAARLAPVTPVTRLFCFESASIQRLKDMCSAGGEKSSWVSTADSLAALIWRCVIRARAGGSDEDSTLMMAMDVRRLVTPPISNDYLGNAVLYSVAKATVGQLSDSNRMPLGAVARSVRASLRDSQQADVLRETLQLAASIPDVSALSLVYPTWLANDVVLSSICGLPFYDITWGGTFGEQTTPDFFRFPQGTFDGVCFVLPRHWDGSVEAQITMDAEHMQALADDAEFQLYATSCATGKPK